MTTDQLGSPRVITDKNGEVISRRDFMPFGEEIYAGVGNRTTNQKYSTNGIDNVRQRFTGYQKDQESELDFAEARMYKNNHARFTAPDSLLASASLGNPQTFNRYVYVGNNPINITDPSGLAWCTQSNNVEYRKGSSCPDGWSKLPDNYEIDVTNNSNFNGTGPQVNKGTRVRLLANGKVEVVSPTASSASTKTAPSSGSSIQAASNPSASTGSGGTPATSGSNGGGSTDIDAGFTNLPSANGGKPIIIPLCDTSHDGCGSSSYATFNSGEIEYKFATIEGSKIILETASLIPAINIPATGLLIIINLGEGDLSSATGNSVGFIPGGKLLSKGKKFTVGLHKNLKKVSAGTGLDSHHVGQSAVMKKLIPNYDARSAPAILVPKRGHTRRRGSKGVVSRSTKGFKNARQVVARDILELRRVYPEIPNKVLRELIELNKKKYPQIRYKVYE